MDDSRTEPVWTAELVQWAEAEACAVGFERAGVAAVEGLADEQEARDADRFEAWIAAGRAGEMEYLKRRDAAGRFLRTSARVPMDWARSVVVCAANYSAAAPLSINPAAPGTGWIARYAWSGRRDAADAELRATDYHKELLARLHDLAARLEARMPCVTRCYVDTGPLVERALAVRAGVGWIGKNTCVLDQQLGSWMLLGTIVTSVPVATVWFPELNADRCGSCTRCIDACPTQALVEPRTMDATRCIAYLTIEKKGVITEDLRASMGRQIFGCDICQDVCPWNRRSPVAHDETMEPRPELVNPDLEEIARLDAKQFRRAFQGSPLERTGRKRLQRNVAIAMGNSGDERFEARLEQWSAAEDPVLAETAQWARRRLRTVRGDASASPSRAPAR